MTNDAKQMTNEAKQMTNDPKNCIITVRTLLHKRTVFNYAFIIKYLVIKQL